MRVIVRTVSEPCVTAGTLIVLFVVHALFWTGVRADGVMDDQIDLLREEWSRPPSHLRRLLRGLPQAAARGRGGADRRHDLVHVRIDKGPYRTVPSDIEVIDPVPRPSGYTRPGRYLTLTTREPEWGHSRRVIVRAHPVSTQPVEAGKPEALRR